MRACAPIVEVEEHRLNLQGQRRHFALGPPRTPSVAGARSSLGRLHSERRLQNATPATLRRGSWRVSGRADGQWPMLMVMAASPPTRNLQIGPQWKMLSRPHPILPSTRATSGRGRRRIPGSRPELGRLLRASGRAAAKTPRARRRRRGPGRRDGRAEPSRCRAGPGGSETLCEMAFVDAARCHPRCTSPREGGPPRRGGSAFSRSG